MKKYIIRSIKYLVALTALYLLLVKAAVSTSQMPLTIRQYFGIMFSTWKGWTLVAGTILLAATYPRFGFVSRRVRCSLAYDREQIDSAMRVSGYELREERDGVLAYRVSSPLSRLVMLGEDELRVWQEGDEAVISGLRRSAVKACLRLEGYMDHKRRV